MKRIRIITALLLPAFFMLSCNKYLDVKPKGVIIAETINDYEGLLNDMDIVNPFGLDNPILFSTDDLWDISFSPQNQTAKRGNIYFWREYINNGTDRPTLWAELYNNIANLNVVTEGVLSAKDGTELQRKQLYAEAMVAKAFNYFHLLSFFAPAYNKATATADYGVPYVSSTDQSAAAPARPSLQVSYDNMINDVAAAVPDLPERNINTTRVTKLVAYGMLTRIYMSMGDYANAEKYADMVLGSGKASVLNYNDYVGSALPQTNNNPEELFVRYTNNSSFRCSGELLSKYDLVNDLRIKLLTEKDNDGFYKYGGKNYNPNRGITYAEIYLDKAECLARKDNVDDALEIINTTIRENRFSPDKYTPLTANDKEEAINAVLEERRRELALKGVRWSDMKRLDKEGRMPEVKRYAADGTTVLVTLTPGSVNYTFQIPLLVQSFNAEMPLNKR